jgi:phage portal protein BeeE
VLPSGYLRQTGGEPLSSQELSDLAAQFNLARTSGNNTAALNEFLEYVPTTATPDKMLMIESADYSARDLGRILGVPSYLLSVSIGAYSYQSSQQSRIDLWTYACKALADCITETLSSDNVLPHGTMVSLRHRRLLSRGLHGHRPRRRPNERNRYPSRSTHTKLGSNHDQTHDRNFHD